MGWIMLLGVLLFMICGITAVLYIYLPTDIYNMVSVIGIIIALIAMFIFIIFLCIGSLFDREVE